MGPTHERGVLELALVAASTDLAPRRAASPAELFVGISKHGSATESTRSFKPRGRLLKERTKRAIVPKGSRHRTRISWRLPPTSQVMSIRKIRYCYVLAGEIKFTDSFVACFSGLRQIGDAQF
jgi:hypothetical protein